jgi:hypothetical protein
MVQSTTMTSDRSCPAWHTNQKIAGKFIAHVWGQLHKPPTMVTVGAIGMEDTIIPSFA